MGSPVATVKRQVGADAGVMLDPRRVSFDSNTSYTGFSVEPEVTGCAKTDKISGKGGRRPLATSSQ